MESGGRAASSDEEVDQEDVRSTPSLPAPAPAGARPYYECVFCRRGFTAAQALGGHMNIHRRDRARHARAAGAVTSPSVSRRSTSTSTTGAECHDVVRHRRLASYSQAAPPPQPVMPPTANRGMLWRYAGDEEEAVSSPSPVELSLFFGADTATHDHDHDDLRLGLGCYGEVPERPDGGEPPPERKLDLELRLGRVDRPTH